MTIEWRMRQIDWWLSKGFTEKEDTAWLLQRLKETREALKNLSDLYDSDDGCRKLPQYLQAKRILEG